MRRQSIAGLWLCLVLGFGCQAGSEIERPNLVVIIGDDHGYPYAGFMGSDIVVTPHLDRLAAEGTVFSNAYNVASTCRPSLMSLLTGLDPFQVELRSKQLERQGRGRKDFNRILDFETLPALLAQGGYRSFQAGKHWEGSAKQAGFTSGTKSIKEATGSSFVNFSGGQRGLELGRTGMEPVWEMLEQAEGEPFLLWFAPKLPHAPLDAPGRYRAPYLEAGLSNTALAYYANITRLDAAIGELLERLSAMGLRDRTLVVYLSDNGWEQAPEVLATGRAITLGGARGKMSMFELGFRTPVVFHWPDQVPAGIVRDELVSTLDLFPTLLDYAGLGTPPGRWGHSLRAVIEDRVPLRERAVYGRMAGALMEGVDSAARSVLHGRRRPALFARRGRWHYFNFEPEPGEPIAVEERLYDIEADPQETRNLATEKPEVVAALRREIKDWKQRAVKSLPRSPGRRAAWTASD